MRAAVLLLVACGGSTQPPPQPAGPPATTVAQAAGSDDVVVATVNGRPVWGSCVAAQHSLDDCIGFELMAQEAERRGLAKDPDVVLAARTAMVSRVVEKEYEDAFTKPGDFGSAWDQALARNRVRYDHPEVRASAFVRVPVDKPADDAAAHALADQIAQAAGSGAGWMSPQLFALADQVAAGRPIQHQDVPPMQKEQLDATYGAALYGLPEVGRTSGAVRTKWGWDIVLYRDVLPEVHLSEAQIAAQLLPDMQRSYFSLWVHHLEQAMGIHVEQHPEQLENLPQ
jgi:peptidyl-prolyl cis-trans isomerase C